MDVATLTLAKGYTDSQRLAYEETKKFPALEAVTIKAGKNYIDAFDEALPFVPENMVELATYIVTVDDVKYEKKSMPTPWGILIGNGKLYNPILHDTGECFAILFDSYDSWNNAVCLAEPATKDTVVTCEIVKTVVQPIEQKFLPGLCLPVVEINATNEVLSAEDSEELTKCIGSPIVLKLTHPTMGVEYSVVSSYVYSPLDGVEGGHFFVGATGGLTASSKDGVNWTLT